MKEKIIIHVQCRRHPEPVHTSVSEEIWNVTALVCVIFYLHISFMNVWNMIFQFSSVTQLCPSHCDPMDCSTPGFPVHQQLPEFAQIHVYRVGDAIQISHLLSSPSLPSIFPRVKVFSNESVLHIRWPKKWSSSFSISPSNEYSGLISSRILIRSPCCPRDSQESSPAPQFKGISSLALSFLYSPTLTSIHDYWKTITD